MKQIFPEMHYRIFILINLIGVEENPHARTESHFNIYEYLIGLFLQERLDGNSNHDLLQDDLPILLKNVTLL